MAKDPAFLFYPGDFMTGTQFFTDEQVGKYIRLLLAQHQLGHLEEKHMLQICKLYDKDIFSKFMQDSKGLFYNERLDNEIVKRRNYTDSRSKNRKSTKNICKSYDEHMENRNRNINKDINSIDSYIEFRKSEFEKYPDAFKKRLQEFGIDKPLVYITNRADDQYKDFVEIIHDSVTDEQWQMQISRGTTSEKIRIELTKFIDYLLKSQSFREYMTKNDFQRHFVNRQKLVK